MAVSDTSGGTHGPSKHSEEYGARLTVDLDAKDYSRRRFRLRATRTWHNLQQHAAEVDVHVSSSGKGLHLVAWYEEELEFFEQVKIRNSEGDDPRRVWMDCQRWLEGLYTDVLFEDKDARPQTKERRFRDVYDALDYIDEQQDDYQRMQQLAENGGKGAPELIHKARWHHD